MDHRILNFVSVSPICEQGYYRYQGCRVRCWCKITGLLWVLVRVNKSRIFFCFFTGVFKNGGGDHVFTTL